MPRGLKRLGYRSQLETTQEQQAAHWEGFTFTSGPWQVKLVGPWGQLQVWASSEAEGRRVIEHACAGAGIDPADPAAEWQVAQVTHPRYQRVATYRTMMRWGVPVVTMRQGADGQPILNA